MKGQNMILPAAVLALSTSTASANQLSLFETQFDTDWAAAGVGGLRGTGASTISLSGVTGTVTTAYLYWHGPTDSTDPTHNANISFSGTAISGSNIGFSDDNFWSRANSQAYRADVTSLVSGDGNYSISGLIPNDSNGASLMVFFDDGDSTNNRDVVIFDGNDANFPNAFDPDGWDITLGGINYSSGTASLLFGVSDGQDFLDAALVVNGTNIADSGAVFQGASVPTTLGTSVGNGALWDLLDYDVTSLLLPGLNTLNITHGTVSDALSAIHITVDLPAGAAPPAIPIPAAVWLFGSGLLGLIGIASRKKTA